MSVVLSFFTLKIGVGNKFWLSFQKIHILRSGGSWHDKHVDSKG